jgi:Flp pilus assembly protein TadD
MVAADDWRLLVNAYAKRARDIADRAYGEFVYALARKPGDERTVWQIAETLRVLGRYPEAQELFLSLTKRNPNEWLYPYRGAVVTLANNEFSGNQLTIAIELLHAAHSRRPDQADVLNALGFALLKARRPAEARAQLEKANAFEPFNPAAFNNLGIARAQLDDLAGAERAFRRGLELRTFPLPRTHLLHTNLALVLAKKGQRYAAMAAARSALHVFPAFTPATHLLAELQAGSSVSLEYQINDQLELFGELSTVSPLDLTL